MIKSGPRILVVDDDADVLAASRVLLKQHFTTIQVEQDPKNIIAQLNELQFDIILLDMNFSKGREDGMEGLNLLEHLVRTKPGLPVIMMTAYGEVHLAVEAMKRGAYDFILKPWRNDDLLNTINKAVLKSSKSAHTDSDDLLIGQSEAIQYILNIIEKVAPTEANILITGENGTGKTRVAELIHKKSKSADGPFVTADLGAIPNSLFESELFGHVKGAFTDAKVDRKGKFESAQQGTVFLDEIGNIPLVLQSKLLTVLQERKVQRIGGTNYTPLDVRFLTATNQPLKKMVDEGKFRQDLLYRINTIEIPLPPLRERKSDISLLANHFLSQYADQYKKKWLSIDKSVLKHLEAYHWPGNIRELNHSIERAVILSDNDRLTLGDFTLSGVGQNQKPETLNLKANEKKLIVQALEENGGNITHAAKALGIDRLALYRRMEKYGL